MELRGTWEQFWGAQQITQRHLGNLGYWMERRVDGSVSRTNAFALGGAR